MISAPMNVSPASFRDPSGFLVEQGGEFLRVVQPVYAEDYKRLFDSGLYAALTDRKLLIPHQEIPNPGFDGAFKVLRPRQLSFISYPYEWCFSQLKDAALATLAIQNAALEHGMALKDASAFNIQFVDGQPALIDLLSFEKLEPHPWNAYGQFCRHFLAPLALISRCDPRLGRLSMVHLDGVPLDLACKLLRGRGRWNLWLLMHLYWHAASERKAAGRPAADVPRRNYSLNSLRGLMAGLESAVNNLRWRPAKAAWANYYDRTVTGGNYLRHKTEIVADMLHRVQPRAVWDLGANTGLFSRLAAEAGAETYSFDADPDCVEINYLEARRREESRLLPLLMDLTNPSPAIGWDHRERMSWLERRRPDLLMALGLVHHLAIANNLPLARLAEFCARAAPALVIEFVPKDDPNAKKLLTVRRDIFPGYTRENFEREFSRRFVMDHSRRVENSERVVYLMRAKTN
jgi:hypothetical protein